MNAFSRDWILPPAPPSLSAIIAATAKVHDISLEAIMCPSRDRRWAWARQEAMFLCRKMTDASLPEIGLLIGRDHTTILHAERSVAARMDPRIAARLKEIEAEARLHPEQVKLPRMKRPPAPRRKRPADVALLMSKGGYSQAEAMKMLAAPKAKIRAVPKGVTA